MSTLEEKIIPQLGIPAKKRSESAVSKLLRFVCSVRLGVVLLCLLGLACLIGMLVMQQNVDGFENYYSTLTPSQRLLYGKLGFFNIYHAWYFNALLCLVSLNIILASIDRFPRTWKFVSKPQVIVPLRWLADQKQSAAFELSGSSDAIKSRAEALLKNFGWRRLHIAEKDGRTYILAESGVWNRLGAYAVHVGLLTIFLGGFLTAQLGTTGNLPLAPGETSNLIRETVVDLDRVSEVTKQLPFEVTFTDIEQKLIRDDGPITAANTLDWITRFNIVDEGKTYTGIAQMNRPFDYRGYRFFQASFVSTGRARNITVMATPADGSPPQELKISRDGSATLPDGTLVRFSEFRGNFRIGPEDPNEDTSAYPNPAAVLQVVPPGGSVQTAYAFGPQMANIPVAGKPVGGYTYRLSNFEKVSDRHILSVQRDPGSNVVYVGFVLLFLTLVAVFFFSHQRVWVVIDGGEVDRRSVTTAGNTNRNPNAFEDKFRRFAIEISDAAAIKEKS
ncbi:MAG TPA: cytochrome c biogenesis protein ResB [Pyrinomonadaceae bacterium]